MVVVNQNDNSVTQGGGGGGGIKVVVPTGTKTDPSLNEASL